MKKLFTREILIGLILVISLSILFIGIDFLKGINVFKSSSLYYVSFDNVTGLTIASPVTINGVKIGQVTDIEYDHENLGNVLVEINLHSDVKIPRDSELLLSTSILGTAELAVKVANNTEFYNEGDRIKGSKAEDMMANISTEVLPEVIKILPHLNNIIANVDSLVANPALQNTIKRLDGISKNIEVTTEKLAKVSGKIEPIVNNADNITTDLTAISSDLKTLSAQLKEIPIKETMDNVKTTSENLAVITTKISGKDSSLGMLLNDKGLYNHLDSTLISLDSILIDLKAHPKKYVNFKLF